MSEIISEVIKGSKIARNIGFPTINLEISKNYPLKFGIYAGILELNNKIFKGVINYGKTPTHLVEVPKFEMHIFEFNQEIYGEIVKVIPKSFIRKERLFSTQEELIKQIKLDCRKAKKLLVDIII